MPSLSTQSSNNKDADELPGKRDEGVSKGIGIDDQERTDSKETDIFDDVYDDREVGAEADTNNLELLIVVKPIPTTRVHKHHPKEQIIGDLNLATQTRRMINFSKENAMVKQKDDGIFIIQDKYVADILKKFGFSSVKTASTPMEPNKALIKDAKAEDVDVHLYRSMIRSLMYLTASRPDIMFSICACAWKSENAQDQGRMKDEDLFRVNYLDGDEVIIDVIIGENVEHDVTVVEKEVSAAADEVVTTAESVEGINAAITPQISKDDVILAQTLIEIKEAKPGLEEL
nr:uncharacterized mitochondrial protein AtMg00810-like [Tanacetum cinerariifolium]